MLSFPGTSPRCYSTIICGQIAHNDDTIRSSALANPNSQTEEQVTRLKLVKRSTDGRAKFEVLGRHVLYRMP